MHFIYKEPAFGLILFLIWFGYGVFVFISGFLPAGLNILPPLPANSLLEKCNVISDSPDSCSVILSNFNHSQKYNKLVLIVIDALRADFVPFLYPNSEYGRSMPFTKTLIENNSAVAFINKVFSPTVTMPRIKTLVSGGMSNFLDVITNLNAGQIIEDNFLLQAKESGKKTVFYGDDTWLKLFPSDFFLRSDGTHSFFVSDFKEVDLNVTRHLRGELSRKDWDIMVLHYLGVDHIGHAFGPQSQHLPSKLSEMDDVIRYIYHRMASDSDFNSSLIVICGDHGMTSSGSHGGITLNETTTPLIFINVNPSNSLKISHFKTVSQVDFAVTISVLLGTSIPSNSLGSIIPEVLQFSGFPPFQTIQALFYNFIQLFEVYKMVFPHRVEERFRFLNLLIRNHSLYVNETLMPQSNTQNSYKSLLESYVFILAELKEDLLRSMSEYDDGSIIVGTYIVWLSLLCLLACFNWTLESETSIPDYTTKHIAFKTCLCLLLCFTIKSVIWLQFLSHWFILCLCGIVISYVGMHILLFFCHQIRTSVLEKTFIVLFSCHILSLFSSSFIEEEHQTWYFFASSILMGVLVKQISLFLKINLQTCADFDYECITRNLLWGHSSVHIRQIVLLQVSHCILRKWNQTGNKWQHLPDISDWLNKDSNFYIKYLSILLSQFLILFCLKSKQNVFIRYLTYAGMIIIVAFKCHLDQLVQYNVESLLLPWAVYFIILVIIVYSISVWIRTSLLANSTVCINFIMIWVLLVTLIGRTHNIPVISLVLLQEYLLNKFLLANAYGPKTVVFLYMLFMNCSFFYMGNSNSISTVDVYSGYVGLTSYRPVIVGFLIFCNTYSTSFLWLQLLFYRLSLNVKLYKCVPNFTVLSFTLLIYKLVILSVYCVVMNMMKHHLFVLSVFAPKLFYEISHVMVVSIFTAMIFIRSKASLLCQMLHL